MLTECHEKTFMSDICFIDLEYDFLKMIKFDQILDF